MSEGSSWSFQSLTVNKVFWSSRGCVRRFIYKTTYEQVTLFEIILVWRLCLQGALAFEQLKHQLNTTQKTVTDHELNSQKKAVNIWIPLFFYGHSLVTPKRCRQRYNKKWTGLCFKRTLRKPRSNLELLSSLNNKHTDCFIYWSTYVSYVGIFPTSCVNVHRSLRLTFNCA